MEPCDPGKTGRFDCSALDPTFSKLGKPAQRALVNNCILSPIALAHWRRADVAALHGIGPSVMERLDRILGAEGRRFR